MLLLGVCEVRQDRHRKGKAAVFWWAKWNHISARTLQAFDILTVKNALVKSVHHWHSCRMRPHSLYIPSNELHVHSPSTGGAKHLIAVPMCCKLFWWFGSNGIFARSANTQERGFLGGPCSVDCIRGNGRWHCWRQFATGGWDVRIGALQVP